MNNYLDWRKLIDEAGTGGSFGDRAEGGLRGMAGLAGQTLGLLRWEWLMGKQFARDGLDWASRIGKGLDGCFESVLWGLDYV